MPRVRVRTRCLPFSAAFLLTAGGVSAAAAAPDHHARSAAAGRDDPGRLSGLSVVAQPADPRAGQPVTLVVLGHTPPGAHYRWQIGSVDSRTLDTGGVSRLTTAFISPGSHVVRLSAQAGSRTGEFMLVVDVMAPRLAPPARRPQAHTRALAVHRPRAHTGGRGAHAHPLASAPSRRPSWFTRTFHLGRRAAHAAAGDPPVTIVDFAFHPGTTTIHAGDTITWTNSGKAPHSATATNNSWNTGILNTGQSGSHTFSQSGTYSYYCIVHPFMKGTIVVLASGTSPTPSSSGTSPSSSGGSPSSSSGGSPSNKATPSATPSTNASTSNSPTSNTNSSSSSTATLPFTGLNLGAAVMAGLVLLGAGVTLRRFSRSA